MISVQLYSTLSAASVNDINVYIGTRVSLQYKNRKCFPDIQYCPITLLIRPKVWIPFFRRGGSLILTTPFHWPPIVTHIQ